MEGVGGDKCENEKKKMGVVIGDFKEVMTSHERDGRTFIMTRVWLNSGKQLEMLN